MRKGTKKSPIQKVPRTKEQIARDVKISEDRRLIVEKVFPALKETTVSVDEATQLLSAMTALVMEEAMNTLRDKLVYSVKDKMLKKLCPDGERQTAIDDLLSLFDQQTLFEARGHFEALKSVIEQMKMDEMRNRKLDTLKEDWPRYLNG